VLRVIAVWILVIFVYSILALIWPHGIIKHYPSEPKLNPTSTQTTSPVTITAPSTTPSKTATTTKATPTTKKP